MAEGNIIVDERVPELAFFYVSGLVSDGNLIIEDIKNQHLTLGAKESWALVQLEAAMTNLFLGALVIPLDKGGVEVPNIAAKEKYVEELERSFPVKRRHRDRLLISLESNAEELAEWKKMEIAEESASQDEKVVTEWQLSVNERDEAIMALNNAYDTEYEKWTVAQAELIADQHKVEEWTTSTKARAIKQHREDSDALLRAEKAMGILL